MQLLSTSLDHLYRRSKEVFSVRPQCQKCPRDCKNGNIKKVFVTLEVGINQSCEVNLRVENIIKFKNEN